MPLSVKLVIAGVALGLSAFAVFGDAFFISLGLPSGSGRIVTAAVLLTIGVVWFLWSSASVRKAARDVASRRSKD